MDNPRIDMNRALMLDGNAAGGLLGQIFTSEMTACPAECAHCGNVASIGALLCFGQAPGVTLRCPVCEEIVMRIAETPAAYYLDVRGAACLRFARR